VERNCKFFDVISNVGGAACGGFATIPTIINAIGQLIAVAGTNTPKGQQQEVEKQLFFAALTLGRDLVARGALLSTVGPGYAALCGLIGIYSFISTACSNVQAYAYNCDKKPLRRSRARLTAFGYHKLAYREPAAFSLVPRSTNQCTDFISQMNAVGFAEACPAITAGELDCSAVSVMELMTEGVTEADAKRISEGCLQAEKDLPSLQTICTFCE